MTLQHFIVSSLVSCNVLAATLSQPYAAQGFSATVVPRPTPVPDYELVKKAITDPGFMGWYVGQQTTSRVACDSSSIWSTSGKYAICCSEGDTCTPGTTCTGLSGVVYPSETFTCNSGYFCAVMTIYETYGVASQTPFTNMMCINNQWSALTLYRDFPSTSASTSSTPPSTSAVTTATTTATAASSTVSTAPSSATSTPPSSSSSQAWIAGAVIGPIAGLAIVGAIAWWCLRSPQNDAATTPQAPAAGAVNGAYFDPNKPYPDQPQSAQYPHSWGSAPVSPPMISPGQQQPQQHHNMPQQQPLGARGGPMPPVEI